MNTSHYVKEEKHSFLFPWFIAVRTYSKKGKANDEVRQLAESLSGKLLKGTGTEQFGEWLKEKVKGIIDANKGKSKWKLGIDCRTSVDGNGMTSKAYHITNYCHEGITDVCVIYLFAPDTEISFVRTMKEEQPLFPEEGGEL